MIRDMVAVIVVIALFLWGSWELVGWAFEQDAKKADEVCSALGAQPSYIDDGHYLCIAEDGRVVGRT